MDQLSGSISDMFGSMKRSASEALGLEEERPKTTWEKIQEAVNLTYKQRLIAWGVCSAIGLFFFLIAFLLFELSLIPEFAVAYTLGNICLVVGILLLAGPVTQVKNLRNPSRLLSVVIFVAAMIVTLFVAFASNGGAWLILILVAVLFQMAAFIWYGMSYIPFAQSLFTAGVSSAVASAV